MPRCQCYSHQSVQVSVSYQAPGQAPSLREISRCLEWLRVDVGGSYMYVQWHVKCLTTASPVWDGGGQGGGGRVISIL